ncbi:MAG: YeeE/YedE thiosulfate transporter family protein [Methanomicrobiales archaeon]
MDGSAVAVWSPYLVGAGIGVLTWFTFLLSDRPLGCSTTYSRTAGMIERFFRGKKVEDRPYYRKTPPQVDWQWMLVVGVVIGAFLSAVSSGAFAIEWVPALFTTRFGPDPVIRAVFAVVGGFFLGLGARWAGGCTSGHGISGALQLAIGSWVAAICFFIGGIVTAMILYGGWW